LVVDTWSNDGLVLTVDVVTVVVVKSKLPDVVRGVAGVTVMLVVAVDASSVVAAADVAAAGEVGRGGVLVLISGCFLRGYETVAR
jgi:hypothetical protein